MTFVVNNNQQTIISGTWDSSSTIFSRLGVNVEDLNSHIDSTLLSLSSNGAAKFQVYKGGTIKTTIGNNSMQITPTLLILTDTILLRDAANIFAQRNGTAAQTFRIYNSYVNSTTYERASLGWNASAFTIQTETESQLARNLVLGTSSTPRITISSVGDIDFNTSSTAARIKLHGKNTVELYNWGSTAPAQPLTNNIRFIGYQTTNQSSRPTIEIKDLRGSHRNNFFNGLLGPGLSFSFEILNDVGGALAEKTVGGLFTVVESGAAGSFGLAFASNGYTEMMRLSNAGNLGIGTTAPSAVLHVDSTSVGNILNLHNSGISRFRVDKDGSTFINGNYNMGTNTGLIVNGTRMYFSIGNFAGAVFGYQQNVQDFNLRLVSTGRFGWASSPTDATFLPDTMLYRDAVGIIAQRNSTNTQKFRVYNTHSTAASSYEALEIGHTLYSTSQFQYVSAITSGTGAANIGIAIVPAGTGAFTLAVPDGGTTGGNTRGIYAIDLQTLRTDNTNVAAGQEAIVIGTRNKASAAFSLAMGNSCDSQSTRCISIGSNSTAVSLNSIAIGMYNTANSRRATVLGNNAYTENYGAFCYATGNFGTQTEVCQSTKLIYTNFTSGATETELFLDGSAAAYRAKPRINTAWFCDIKVLGRQVSGVNHASYWRRCLIENTGNTVQMVSAVETIGTDVETNSAWDVSVTADNTNKSLKIAVTGVADTNIRWMAEVNVLELNYGNS